MPEDLPGEGTAENASPLIAENSSTAAVTTPAEKSRVLLSELIGRENIIDSPVADAVAPLHPEGKAESQVADSAANKENLCLNPVPVLSDSGSDLSETDWLNEDLLPHRYSA